MRCVKSASGRNGWPKAVPPRGRHPLPIRDRSLALCLVIMRAALAAVPLHAHLAGHPVVAG